MGTRLREATEKLPKPPVDIGGRPILLHFMKLSAGRPAFAGSCCRIFGTFSGQFVWSWHELCRPSGSHAGT
jgi:hypothetical protein